MESQTYTFISELLASDGYIQVNKYLIKLLGLHEAILIGELLSEYNYWKNKNKLIDDAFYSTRDNIEENTGLSSHLQRKAFSHLEELNIIEMVKKGMPAVNYYRFNWQVFMEILYSPDVKDVNVKTLKTLTSSGENCKRQDVKTVNLNNNKQTKIKNNNKEGVSKDTHTSNFNFGSHVKETAKGTVNEHNAIKFKELYEEHCPSLGKVKKLNSNRIKLINKLCKTYSWGEIVDVLKKIETSDFLKGSNGWKATFDWIIKESNFMKIDEGNYDNNKSRTYKPSINSNKYVGKTNKQPLTKDQMELANEVY